MVRKQTIVKNPSGLHARPASQLVELCKGFECKIKLESGDKTCDAKSIFSVLRCCIKIGDTVVVSTEGPDEEIAATDVIKFIEALEE